MINPLIIFDYIYYRIAHFYTHTFRLESINEFAAKGILSVLQSINIITLFVKLVYFRRTEFLIFFIAINFILLLLNYYRYTKIIKYKELALKWDNEKKKNRIIKVLCIIFYFLMSVLLYGF
jgi:hypothetical protein